jgi:hypothetical protein
MHIQACYRVVVFLLAAALQPPAAAEVAVQSVAGVASGAAATNVSQTTRNGPDPAAGELAQMRGKLLSGIAVLSLVLGAGTLVLTLMAAVQAVSGGGLRYTSFWGGFGGSGTGWHLTPAAASLLGAVLLALTTVFLVAGLLQATSPSPAETGKAPAAKA